MTADLSSLAENHIPPRFGRIVSDLVDKKVILKDLNGQQWKVKVSKVNGSIAFEEGWDVFSMDHGLEVGYFLVFNYNKDSHFDVKIYDTSACERLDFSKERNQRKRSRDKNGSQVKEGMLVTQGYNALAVTKPDVPKMKCQHREVDLVGMQNIIESAQLMCISEHREDPYHLTSLEFEGKEREDQSRSVDGTMKISNADSEVSKIHHGSHVYQNDASATMCDKEPVFEWILGTEVALDAPELGMSERNSLGETDKSTYDKTSTLKFEENNENKMIMSNADTHKCQSAESLGTTVSRVALSSFPNCEMSKKIKKEIAMAPDLEAAGIAYALAFALQKEDTHEEDGGVTSGSTEETVASRLP
ncbi:hypothetical protein RJT34_13079 [Clitoria ternatea]|uniref:TF-B3 domain-containing protein n=1 Tax=Clitoria ternatea TaxID=43366 RepID=A0AAN9JQX5_CLITE